MVYNAIPSAKFISTKVLDGKQYQCRFLRCELRYSCPIAKLSSAEYELQLAMLLQQLNSCLMLPHGDSIAFFLPTNNVSD